MNGFVGGPLLWLLIPEIVRKQLRLGWFCFFIFCVGKKATLNVQPQYTYLHVLIVPKESAPLIKSNFGFAFLHFLCCFFHFLSRTCSINFKSLITFTCSRKLYLNFLKP